MTEQGGLVLYLNLDKCMNLLNSKGATTDGAKGLDGMWSGKTGFGLGLIRCPMNGNLPFLALMAI